MKVYVLRRGNFNDYGEMIFHEIEKVFLSLDKLKDFLKTHPDYLDTIYYGNLNIDELSSEKSFRYALRDNYLINIVDAV